MDDKLQRLGRIHNAAEAKSAVSLAKVSGLKSFNLDLMHGLPNQTLEEALDDLRQAIELAPPHLSWYQLTIRESEFSMGTTAYRQIIPESPIIQIMLTLKARFRISGCFILLITGFG